MKNKHGLRQKKMQKQSKTKLLVEIIKGIKLKEPKYKWLSASNSAKMERKDGKTPYKGTHTGASDGESLSYRVTIRPAQVSTALTETIISYE